MRCKNCGFENEEGRYICQNCGSPLFDENEQIEENNGEYADSDNSDNEDYENRKNTKKSIAVIVILSVILTALVAGIVFAVTHTAQKETTTAETESITTQTEEITTKKKTTTEKKTTTTEKTTESTTVSTTTAEKTTESTTQAKYAVSVDIDGNGSVTGDGEYDKGKQAVLVATPDADSQFIGWYDNDTGELRASGTKYTVRVNKNINLTAKFQKVEETTGE